jgi:hypothetical protein
MRSKKNYKFRLNSKIKNNKIFIKSSRKKIINLKNKDKVENTNI